MKRTGTIWMMAIGALGAAPVQAASVILKPGDDVKTLTASLQAGDVVQFSDGEYALDEQLSWSGVGTEDSPIVLKAVDGAHPVLKYATDGSGWGIVQVYEAEWLQITGLTFQGDDNYAVRGYVGLQIENSSHVVLKDSTLNRIGGTAVTVVGDNTAITIERNHISETGNGHGIYIGQWDGKKWTSDSVIHNNWIHSIAGGDKAGIYVSPGSYGISMTDNVIHGSENRGIYLSQWTNGPANLIARNAIWSMGNVAIEAHGAAVLQNNILFNSNGYGIYSTPADTDEAASVVIQNNTISGTLKQAVYYRQRVGAFQLANNALCNPLGYAFKSDNVDDEDLEKVTVTGNIACGLVETRDELKTGFEPGAGTDDFQDAVSFDFWPTTGSHLIDAGVTDGSLSLPAEDFNGVERSGTPDVGAYERGGEENPGWILAEGFKETEIKPDTLDPTTVDKGCGCSSGARSGNRLDPWLVALAVLAGPMRRRSSRQSR